MDDPALVRGKRPTPEGLRLRVVLPHGLVMGPGKADLLAGIRETGSIAAAGRAMGMSYKRAWSLIEAMNGAFRAPLVEATRGGSTGGGACLTPLGEEVLERYLSLVARAKAAAAPDVHAISALLKSLPSPD